jgi:uncharacterized protein
MDRDAFDRLTHAYRAWSETRGASADTWLDLMAEEIDFRSLGDDAPELEFTTGARSRDEVRGYLERLMRDWEMIRFDVHGTIAEGDAVVVLCDVAWRHRGTGKTVATPKADVWRFRDGKAVSFMEYYDTAKAIAATQP